MKLSRNALALLGAIAALYFYSRFSSPEGSDPEPVDDPDAGSGLDVLNVATDFYADTVGAIVATISAQTPSANCIATIQQHEGCKLTAYFDVKGYSIGWGHFGVAAGTTWTQAQADAQLVTDAGNAGNSVLKYITVPLNQNQFDALVDFVFALGAGALQGSTLRKVLNQGAYDAVPGELLRWCNEKGVPNASVLARRQAEADVWNTPVDDSGDTDIAQTDTNSPFGTSPDGFDDSSAFQFDPGSSDDGSGFLDSEEEGEIG